MKKYHQSDGDGAKPIDVATVLQYGHIFRVIALRSSFKGALLEPSQQQQT